MTMGSAHRLSRRSALAALALLPLAGCAQIPSSPHVTVRATAAPRRPSASPSLTVVDRSAQFALLEQQFDSRLGVWALDTGTAAEIHYRADERFAFCSTGKAFLAAAILNSQTAAQMDTVIQYRSADLIAHSPITAQNVKTGMSLRELCDAAVRYSDNAAANLLYAHLGGPAQLQAFMRGMGDSVTNMNRTEPDLSFAVPGDLRDTTTPRAWGRDVNNLVLGDVLPNAQRASMVDWLRRNTTGATMIRTAVPADWAVADKTGSGWYGTRNDVAVIWPPERKPWVLAIMSSRAARDATIKDELLAQAGAVIARSFD